MEHPQHTSDAQTVLKVMYEVRDALTMAEAAARRCGESDYTAIQSLSSELLSGIDALIHDCSLEEYLDAYAKAMVDSYGYDIEFDGDFHIDLPSLDLTESIDKAFGRSKLTTVE